MLRTWIANTMLGIARSTGKLFGLQLAIELSDHSIELSMEHVDKGERAWDTSLYKSGNVFVKGYSNPIKPRVEYHETLENPNTVAADEGNEDKEDAREDADTDADGPHVQLISSPRYRDYMRQDLISQLLTPDAQWKLLAYAVLAIGFFVVVNIIVSLSAAGAF